MRARIRTRHGASTAQAMPLQSGTMLDACCSVAHVEPVPACCHSAMTTQPSAQFARDHARARRGLSSSMRDGAHRRMHRQLQLLAMLVSTAILLLHGCATQTAAQRQSVAAAAAADAESSSGASSPSVDSDTAAIPLPAPLEASWVDLGAIALPDPVWGKPAPRCDHLFSALEGFSTRADAATPFPTGEPPSTDAWKGKWWLFSGHGFQSAQFNDSWLLDTTLDPPTWTKMEYNSAPGTLSPRFGGAAAFLPSGVSPPDTGLTALLFGGNTGDIYLDDVMTLNFESATLRTIVPASTAGQAQGDGGDEAGTEAPFGRSYMEWHPLPAGFGSGSLDSGSGDGSGSVLSSTSGSFFLLGGSGASDGRRFAALDRSWDDEYIFNLSDARWRRFGAGACLSNSTRCADQAPLHSYTPALALAAANGSLDLTSELRPAEALVALRSLLHTVHALNATLSADLAALNTSRMTNDPAACKTVCTSRAFDRGAGGDRVYPPPLEGYRAAEMDGKLFVFGGYKCSQFGTQQLGGDACFSNSMWVLDLGTMLWREVVPPAAGSARDAFRAHWPSPRAYAVAGAHRATKTILVQGGAFQDVGGTWYYYNDAFAFDTQLLLFVPLSVRGMPPRLTWSAAGTVAAGGDALLVHGGCFGDVFSDQLLALQIGLVVRASNCHVTGPGLAGATAGRTGVFYIQTRESRPRLANETAASGGTNSSYGMVWGKNATYGTGLALTAQLLSFPAGGSLAQAQPSLVTVRLSELGAGAYRASYTASQGESMQLFVSLDDDPVPGSPFLIHLDPSPTASAAHSAASGWGTNFTERGKTGVVLIQVADAYGNPHRDARFLQGWSNSSSSSSSTSSASSAAADAALLSSTPPRQSWSWLDAQGKTLELRARLGPSASSLSPLPCSVIQRGDGTFALSYAVPDSDGLDSFLLDVQLNNRSILGSPWSVQVLQPVEVAPAWRRAFQVLTALVLAVCALLSFAVFWWREQPLFRSASPAFLQLLVWGSACATLSVLFLTLQSESDSSASDSSCRAYHCCLSVGLMAGMAALLAKSHRVMRIFTAKKLRVTRGLDDAHLAVPTGAAVGIMLLLNLLWAGLNPLRLVLHPAAEYPQVQSFPACEGDNIWTWVGLVLALCALVLVYGIYLAIQTGHVPAQYNESKLIAASVYNIAFCSIVVIPLLLFLGSDSTMLTGRLVVQATVILWCSAFNVVAVCGPKVLAQLRDGEAANRQASAMASGTNVSVANAALSAAAASAARAARTPAAATTNTPKSSGGGGGGVGASSNVPVFTCQAGGAGASPAAAKGGAQRTSQARATPRPMPVSVVPNRTSTAGRASSATGAAALSTATATTTTTNPAAATPSASASTAKASNPAPSSSAATGTAAPTVAEAVAVPVVLLHPGDVEVDLQPLASGASASPSPSPSNSAGPGVCAPATPSGSAAVLSSSPSAAGAPSPSPTTVASPSRLRLLLHTAMEAETGAPTTASASAARGSGGLPLSSPPQSASVSLSPRSSPPPSSSPALLTSQSAGSVGHGGAGAGHSGSPSPSVLSPSSSARARGALFGHSSGGESALSFVSRLQRSRTVARLHPAVNASTAAPSPSGSAGTAVVQSPAPAAAPAATSASLVVPGSIEFDGSTSAAFSHSRVTAAAAPSAQMHGRRS